MANVKQYLNQILTAVYGKDVRQSIHDSIDAINKEVIDYGTTASAAAELAVNSAEAAKISESTATQAADVATEKASEADASAQAASESEAVAITKAGEAEASALAAATSEANALASETASEQYATAAAESEANAKASESMAIQKAQESAISETAAAQSKADAQQYASEADASKKAASLSEINAKTSEDAAKASETASATSEENARNLADTAKSYAVGGTGTRTNEDTDNAKYYKEQAQQIVGGIQGGFVPMGTISFAQLASQPSKVGYMYNISDDFTSDETFKDGAGIDYPAGTNVYLTADNMWDCFTGSAVLGVKGDKETVYKKGMVNITPENIGALKEDGNAVSATKAEQDGNGNIIDKTYATKKELENGLLAKADNIYYDEDNDKLQLKSGDTVLSEVTITGGGGGGVSLPQPTNISIVNMDEAVELKWTDPDDVVLDGITLSTWAGTMVVRKAGSAPANKSDGTIVVDSKVKNQYSETGFTDENLTNGVTYYYGIFPYTDTKIYTYSYTNNITPEAIYPTAPSDVSVSGGNAEITVTFTKPDDATGIRIVYGTTSPTSETDGTVIDTTTSPYTITGLTNDIEHFVRVYSYNAKGRFTASSALSATPKELTIVTWADGSFDDISKMLEAHYAGTIDIADYWAVGDTKTVSLSAMSATGVGESHDAQDVELTIIGIEHDNLKSAINGKTKAAVTIQMKNLLNNGGYMFSNYNGPSYSLWSNSPRRTWCNNIFKASLPTALKNIIKTVTKKTWRYCHNSYSGYSNYRTQQSTDDDCFLLSEFEVFGTQTLPSSTYGNVGDDGTQYDYYKTTSNRIKNKSGSAYYWWLRASRVSSNGSAAFRYVDSDGSAASSTASSTNGLAVGFCL